VQQPGPFFFATDCLADVLAKVRLGIPAKSNSIPEGSRTGFRADPEHPSERSDAGILIVKEVFGLVKEAEVRSEAEGRRQQARERGAGKGTAVPFPARHWRELGER
jgi:hypothetical protein